MNELIKPPTRRTWTLAELDRLGAAGFFGADEHVELIGGELITMAPKGVRHETVRSLIARHLNRRLPLAFTLEAELGWRPRGQIYLEPDILIAPAERRMALVAPERVILVIEVAKWSLDYDLSLKARTYAELGVRDYWAVDAVTLTTRLHRAPSSGGYGDVADLSASETLVPRCAPELALRLADLDIGDDDLGSEES